MASRNSQKPGAAGKKESASDSDRERVAVAALRPSVNAAAIVAAYGSTFGVADDDIATLMERLGDEAKDVWAGDMKRAEAMLVGQAHALQSIFTNLARRATSQEYLKQWEAYLRMALKAQSQCRMTLETLAAIKNPPVVFARQANINNGGQQQVNNGPAAGSATSTRTGAQARAANPSISQSGLLEASDGQGLDTGAAGAAGGADLHLEAVGQVNRSENR